MRVMAGIILRCLIAAVGVFVPTFVLLGAAIRAWLGRPVHVQNEAAGIAMFVVLLLLPVIVGSFVHGVLVGLLSLRQEAMSLPRATFALSVVLPMTAVLLRWRVALDIFGIATVAYGIAAELLVARMIRDRRFVSRSTAS
jgi:hypothetical protein